MVRRQAGVVSRARPVFAGPAHPSISRSLSIHLLLLSWRVLPGVLGRSAVLRRRRTEQELLGRELVSADPAEHPPLFSLHRLHLPVPPRRRCLAGHAVAEW